VSGARQRHETAARRVHTGSDAEAVLRVLRDERCRRILGCIDTEPRAADDIAQVADVPLSTTYTKVETLVDGGLVDERTVVRDDGHHHSRYVRVVDDVDVSVGDDGSLRAVVNRRRPP
jgi:hypothetical protein